MFLSREPVTLHSETHFESIRRIFTGVIDDSHIFGELFGSHSHRVGKAIRMWAVAGENNPFQSHSYSMSDIFQRIAFRVTAEWRVHVAVENNRFGHGNIEIRMLRRRTLHHISNGERGYFFKFADGLNSNTRACLSRMHQAE